MKKLLVIILCGCIFVPEAARIVAGSFCAYTVIDEEANPVCACEFNNIPFEMEQTSFPDRHKEIMQQTEWQYLTAGLLNYNFLFIGCRSNKYASFESFFTSSCLNSIFHPPCFS